MKLDATVMRAMNRQDFRVLAAVETGMKNHELVPSQMIASIAALRHGGCAKVLSSLLRDKLLSHDQSCGYDGYRLTNSGFDILALSNLKQRGVVAALGDRIGTGKESDVYVAANPEGKQIVLKFHRLGRTSFRDVKKKRDYFMVNATTKNKKRGTMPKQQPNSWLFLSRVSAVKEYTFMKALYQMDYPTPTPLAQNRHIVVMGLVRGSPLYQIHPSRMSPDQAESIFHQSTALASRLAQNGLVHCDLNEFNLLVDLSGVQDQAAKDNDVSEHYVRNSGVVSLQSKSALSARDPLKSHLVDGTGEFVTEAPPKPIEYLADGEPRPVVTLIDFPQMVSTRHPNAQELFERDLASLKRFFTMKMKCIPSDGFDEIIPSWDDLVLGEDQNDEMKTSKQVRLDKELHASGFTENDAQRDLELYYFTNNADDAVVSEQVEGIPEMLLEEKEEKFQDNHHLSESIHDKLREKEQHASEVSIGSLWSPSKVAVLDDSSFVSEMSIAAQSEAKLKVSKQMRAMKSKQTRGRGFHRTRNVNKTYYKETVFTMT